jgi:hypothetical protein
MSYNQYTTPSDEPGGTMTVEEEFVLEALSEYREEANWRVWCVIEDLYRVYKGAWLARGQAYPGDDDPKLLSKQQFGAALNAVFPNTEQVTRRVDGKRKRGRACLNGPIARTIKGAGRPRN